MGVDEQESTRARAGAGTEETLGPEEGGGVVGGASISQGTVVGRYVVLSRLGSGGMGVVFAAYDPQLDRKIALKVLQPRGRERGQASQRLQREAQALARLNHPNVVAVHDVGVHDQQVFLAMEFVEGETIRDWMKQASKGRPRSWSEVVAVLADAGEGLAAAHGQGLVHRDFKPDNVMVGHDGRVRVMDFGLARAQGLGSSVPSSGSGQSAISESTDPRLTQTGALLGTPAYMAPEQFMAKEVTERADQFAYCVVLHEALFGVRPFLGETIGELTWSVSRGRRRALPKHDVPPWLRKIVWRGLSLSPGDRFPSMSDLLAAVGEGESRRRRRRWLLAGGATALTVMGALGALELDRARRLERCVAAGDSIDEVWNRTVREDVRQGLLATGLGHAATTADKLMPWVDEHAESWRASAHEACVAKTVQKRWSAQTFDRAQWCLQDRRMQLTMLLDGLEEADPRRASQAVEVATKLQSVDDCRDEGLLARMNAPPAELRLEVSAVREEIGRARQLDRAGRYEESVVLVREARKSAEALEWPPLVASALLVQATALGHSGDLEDAEALSLEAYVIAAKSSTWSVAADAAMNLVHVVGLLRARHEEGRVWAEHARVASELAGGPTVLREAAVLNNLGAVHYSAGSYAQARASYEQALGIQERVYGAQHPQVATTLNNLGMVLEQSGDPAGAIEAIDRALTMRKATLGADHPQVARTMVNLGNVYYGRERYEDCKALYSEALAIFEGAYGPEHPDLATLCSNLGSLLMMMDELDQAEHYLERALSIHLEVLGPEHPQVGVSLNNQANLYIERGELERARPVLERSIEIRRRALGPRHPSLAHPLMSLGRLSVSEGDVAEGLALLERAASLAGPAVQAKAHFSLGKALWSAPEDLGRDRARAREVVERALELRRRHGSGPEEIERWLDEHPAELVPRGVSSSGPG